MTVRVRLMIAVIAVIVAAHALLSWFALNYVERVWFSEVQTRVQLDLNSARAAYDNRMEVLLAFLRAAALERRILEARQDENQAALETFLKLLQQAGEMDVLSVLDADGRVIYRVQNPTVQGDDLSANAVVRRARQAKKPVAGTILVPHDGLLREGTALAARASFIVRPTPGAVPTKDSERHEGMMIAVAVPVRDDQGRVVGYLYAADLLNRRYELVDAIKDEVFLPQTYKGKDVGTVTVFQGDLRIATNVVLADGARAVGTRLSAAVYEEVLVQGRRWAAPAFVVDDWYITAYEPIRDPEENIIGVLYVGLLRAPFVAQRNVLSALLLGAVVGATVLVLLLLFVVTKVVLRPISRIIEMHHQIIGGDLSARVGIRPRGEMGELCRAIDEMAEAVEKREAQLKQATETQISRSERMASVGRLAAGVAHEINNPLTGVLSFAHLLKEKPNMDAQDREDLNLIINETTRVAEIVRGLLEFSREGPVVMAALDVNEAIRRVHRLIRNQKAFEQITIEKILADTLPPIDGDMNQLQQVFLNIALNACAAMSNGGQLTMRTAAVGDEVVVSFNDTGCGIPRAHLDRIFEPFFSTKPVGKGTGLGLSVSYGIVQQHGGTIDVESIEGKGTTVTIRLPVLRPSRVGEATARA